MPVLNRAGVLGIFLRTAPSRELRVGTLVRDAGGAITFDIDEKYIGFGGEKAHPQSCMEGSYRRTLDQSAAEQEKQVHQRNDLATVF